MDQQNNLELAKQGNAKAIAALMTYHLLPQNITAKAARKDNCLQILLEAAQVPDQRTMISFVRRGITSLGAEYIQKVKVYGKRAGEDFPVWSQEIELVTQTISASSLGSSSPTVMAQQNNLELAKQGDLKAFAAVMNYYLQPKHITAKAALKDNCLQILLEAAQVPDQQTMIPFVRREITTSLGANLIERVKVYGRQTGEEFPAWSQEFETISVGENAQLNLSSPKADTSVFSLVPDSSIREAAKKRDLNAISSLVSQAFTSSDVTVEAEIKLGSTLRLRIKSLTTLNPQTCTERIIKILNEIQPNNISLVLISAISLVDENKGLWNRFLYLEGKKFIDRTKILIWVPAICGVSLLWQIFVMFTVQSTPTRSFSTASTSSSSTASQFFLGRSQAGYELWADKSCVYVKGFTEADLARLNTNVWVFKDEVKAQTGYKCVLFE